MQIPIIKGDKIRNGPETDYRDALPVNMFAVRKDILKAKGYMMCWDGITKKTDVIGSDRGGIYNDRQSAHYRVSGEKFISVDTDGTISQLGDVTGISQVALAYSFNTQCIVANGNAYLYDASTGFRQITDVNIGAPIDVEWINQLYVFTDGEYIYHTSTSDESVIEPDAFATAEFMPDVSLGVAKTSDNKLMVMGRYSLEYFTFQDVSTGFKFRRIEARGQKFGIVATHAKCEIQGSWYFTGGHKKEPVTVYKVKTGQSEKISTREIDKILAQYSEPDLANMRMEGYSKDDVTFILIHLPNETLCYNETIAQSMGTVNAWSILHSNATGSPYTAINVIFDPRSGEWLVGDKSSNVLGYLDNSVFTQYDVLQEWQLFSPILKLEGKSIHEMELETIPGHSPYNDATVAVSATFDGLTYSQEFWQTYGSPNNYDTRFLIRNVGYIEHIVGYKFRGATKSRMSFAFLNVEYD